MNQPTLILRPGALTDEIFSFEDSQGWQHIWNVTAGRRLAEARGELQPISLQEYGITVTFIRSQYTDLDEAYALSTALTKPLLFVPLSGKVCLADGWHRLFRAAAEGIDILSAYFLTQEEAEAVLICTLPPGQGVDWRQPTACPGVSDPNTGSAGASSHSVSQYPMP